MDGMILKRGGDPSKLKTITETYVATEGQTNFPIEYSTFDYKKDTVFVISGRTILTPDLDYTLVGDKVVLVEGVPKDRTVTIRILKNVNTDAVDKTMSGAYIEDGSIPLSKLAEPVDVSGQIDTHNSDPNAHADIREGFLPIEGGTVTGTEIGINNNRGKVFASGNVTRLYATENPSDTANQRYFNLFSQFFKEDISESLKVTERIDGADKSYKIYGEHNITSGTEDLTAGTSALPSGNIYLVYE